MELYMFAGRPRQALRILNHRLADLAEVAAQPGGAARGALGGGRMAACRERSPGSDVQPGRAPSIPFTSASLALPT